MTKKVIFVFLGLAISISVFFFARNITISAKENGKEFGDWVVSCIDQDNGNYVLSQQVSLSQNDKQQPVALFRIGYFGDKKELKLVQTLPLGVSLRAGSALIMGKEKIVTGEYTTCTNSGCIAVSSITDKELNDFLASPENSVVFMSLEQKQITLPISNKGLKKGLKYIK